MAEALARSLHILDSIEFENVMYRNCEIELEKGNTVESTFQSELLLHSDTNGKLEVF